MEVTLEQMLSAREERAFRQFSLNRKWGLPIISFSMNIPGPVKDSPLIRRGFDSGLAALDHRLPKAAVKHREVIRAVTGCEAVYVLDMEPEKVKAITTAIEDDHGLGRLFDMDVIGPDLNKLDRELVSGGSRDCIVCGAPGRGCASRRVHSVKELQRATGDILAGYFRGLDAEKIGVWAVQSLLDEVCTTPKPGLVDRRNSGSHGDMDIFTFMASAAALGPYFRRCAGIGQQTAAESPEETFRRLRIEGLRAEQEMYAATGGVNTHKGAVFTIGILCGAAGRLWKPEGGWSEDALFREVSSMTVAAMEEDLRHAGDDTVGARLYAQRGIRGIRGEVARGLPSVAEIGLPVYRSCLEGGMDQNMSGAVALLHLIARVEDTNMISRGGPEGAKAGAEKAAALLACNLTLEQMGELDDWFMERNLSPGGCADLLAAVYFFHSLTK